MWEEGELGKSENHVGIDSNVGDRLFQSDNCDVLVHSQSWGDRIELDRSSQMSWLQMNGLIGWKRRGHSIASVLGVAAVSDDGEGVLEFFVAWELRQREGKIVVGQLLVVG